MIWARLRCLLSRRPPLPPVPTPAERIARSIVSAAMRDAAERYVAAHLRPGEKFYEETDGPFVRGFRELIPAALARKGLQLVQIEGGWRVQRSAFPALPPLPVECSICHESVFRCRHGEGTVWEAKE